MKIQVVSDLHVNSQPDWGRSLLKSIMTPQMDLLIIAGDLGEVIHPSWEQALIELTTYYPYVLLVLGNREYYNSTPEIVQQMTSKLQKELPNLYILENQTITLEGVRFAGTTLWFNDTSKTDEYEKSINNSEINNSFDVWVYQRNQAARKFLADLNVDIIITHYLPSPKSISQEYQNHPRNYLFVSDVEDIIHKIQPLYWLHGHTHSQCAYKIGRTQVIANPHGYPQEASNHGFVRHLCLSISHSIV
ncbi:metallophosphoesterase [Aetokthonos hydrillicola Thurmond2011]|jgi:Icc-related predicted phosphoesterase|uniref:Metallophosphoesterase n=1 Tax=Aetokthonos hydrillicola Thurmond2011 TaxID=2712845 RepID=A0AAP5IG10_9CYAN|nr:metallophosphoesterase [Aetokthonos hydrillicola]MBO3463226.1 hypothetical protein [Aetokthonos hydrillicola CCALA 1050]MBW4590720.1 metallophosphoesterase family protein [Aetokthonos hydrillicola CCALA 1050]MDR9899769.1 metallophosphoesterase [Aetokthonos hydrillicola Thurmond2011]